MPYPPQQQRPMPLGGMARGMAQQGGAPQQGAPPGAVPTVQRAMPQNPWMQQSGAPGGWGAQNAMMLQGLARGLGGQAGGMPQNWGDNGDAPTIRNPSAGQQGPGGPMQAAALQQAAARFAGMQKPGMIAEDDPRMRGAVR